MQISSCDNVGRRSESGALYHAGFDNGDSRQLASISRAMMSVGEKVLRKIKFEMGAKIWGLESVPQWRSNEVGKVQGRRVQAPLEFQAKRV